MNMRWLDRKLGRMFAVALIIVAVLWAGHWLGWWAL